MSGYTLKVGDKIFSCGTHIMGIVNMSVNSFYSLSIADKNPSERAKKMIEDGAEIIDIGGQSTKPKAVTISEIEEASIILPAVEEIVSALPNVILSVDTFYPEIARKALEFGAKMINDVSGLYDKDMASVIANAGASVCIMHNRRGSKNPDMWLDKMTGLLAAAQRAEKAGIEKNKILIDGGIGFNLSANEDIELLNNYQRLSDLGYALLLGASRKSFLGGTPETRLSATLDTTATAVKKGVSFVRVHDVKENKAVIDLYER